MALLRFDTTDPLGTLLSLQNELERLMGNLALGRGLSGVGAYPPVNIFDSQEGAVLVAELPGLDAGKISVAGKARTLTISGERKFEPNGSGGGYHRRELNEGWFSRSIHLSEDYDVQKAEVLYEAGVLIVRIPKTEQANPRQITVQTA